MEDVLFVLELKSNLLSILGLEKKGFRVAFVDGEVLIWLVATLKHTVLPRGSCATPPKRCWVEGRRHKVLQRGS